MHSSVREIRARLLLLLSRAFVLVLALSLIFFIVSFIYFLTAPSSRFPVPFMGALQGYYIGHGSWDGVETVFDQNNDLKRSDSVLLDTDGQVIFDHRSDKNPVLGLKYIVQSEDLEFPIIVDGKKVGSLTLISFSVGRRVDFVREIIFPVSIVSSILVVFMIVVAILLMRRFVNPLADVIYAARSVASGKLDTRIPTEGPQDLRGLSESFNEMATSLERNDRERRDMLADIAHELRTPLSVIRGRLEGIVDGIYPETDVPVSNALEQTYLMERLVDDLRLLTLAESGQLHFEPKPVDIGNLTQQVVDLFQAEAHEKKISLSLNKLSDDLVVQADAQRTEQVIANLVGNALRYVPENGSVWLEASSDGGLVKLSVNDNGKGVPENDLPFIFERFWRKDKSRSRVSGGTGLGLAIAKQLIEAQGGKISARNLPEGGLQVLIELKK
jgi:signal transduction histidine kinase